MQESCVEPGAAVIARGMFWLADENAFRRLWTAAPDREALGETYSVWRQNSIRVFNRASRNGEPRVQVPVNLNAFLFWCKQKGTAPHQEAREAFAQVELARITG